MAVLELSLDWLMKQKVGSLYMFSFALIPFCLCWVVLLLSVYCYSSFLTCLLVDSIRLALAHGLGLCSGPFYIVVCIFSATTVLLRFSHFPYATGVWSTRSLILRFLSSHMQLVYGLRVRSYCFFSVPICNWCMVYAFVHTAFSQFPYATGVWSTRSFILLFLSSHMQLVYGLRVRSCCFFSVRLFCTFQAVIYVLF